MRPPGAGLGAEAAAGPGRAGPGPGAPPPRHSAPPRHLRRGGPGAEGKKKIKNEGKVEEKRTKKPNRLPAGSGWPCPGSCRARSRLHQRSFARDARRSPQTGSETFWRYHKNKKKKDVFTHTPRNVGMRHWLRGPSAWRWLRRHAQPSLPPHEPLLSCSTQSSAAPAPTLATLGFPPAHASGNRQSNLPDCLHKTRITEKWKFRNCPGA